MSELVNGLFYKVKHQNAPDFVLGNLSVKRTDLIEFLKGQSEDWINMQILMSKAGKPYIAVDTWKPTPQQQDAIMGEEEMKKRVVTEAIDLPSDTLPF
jgi:hypothetical protein